MLDDDYFSSFNNNQNKNNLNTIHHQHYHHNNHYHNDDESKSVPMWCLSSNSANTSDRSLNASTFRNEFEHIRVKAKEMMNNNKIDMRVEFKSKMPKLYQKEQANTSIFPVNSSSSSPYMQMSTSQIINSLFNKAKMHDDFDEIVDVDLEIAKLTLSIDQCMHLLQDSVDPEQVIEYIHSKAAEVKLHVQDYLRKLYALARDKFNTSTANEYILASCIQASHWYFIDEICGNVPSYHPFSDESQYLEVILQRFEGLSFEREFNEETKKWTFNENAIRVLDAPKNRKVVGGILLSPDETKMLLVRPKKQRFFLDQKWVFPKGKVEIDEEDNLLFAAKAEILEEAGVDVDNREVIGALRFDNNQTYFIFADIEIKKYKTKCPYEIDKVAWFPVPPTSSLETLNNLLKVNAVLEGKRPAKKDYSKYKEERNQLISSLEKDYGVNVSPIHMVLEVVKCLVSWKKKKTKKMIKKTAIGNNGVVVINSSST